MLEDIYKLLHRNGHSINDFSLLPNVDVIENNVGGRRKRVSKDCLVPSVLAPIVKRVIVEDLHIKLLDKNANVLLETVDESIRWKQPKAFILA